MISLLSLHKYISRLSFWGRVLVVLLLGLVSLGGFVHNHADDPFHLASHEDCPASILAHTPFSNLLPYSLVIIAHLLTFLCLPF